MNGTKEKQAKTYSYGDASDCSLTRAYCGIYHMCIAFVRRMMNYCPKVRGWSYCYSQNHHYYCRRCRYHRHRLISHHHCLRPPAMISIRNCRTKLLAVHCGLTALDKLEDKQASKKKNRTFFSIASIKLKHTHTHTLAHLHTNIHTCAHTHIGT